ncbi:MAG: hypothetical protein E6G26_12805 [Actinobacteria bacterium]|nr:MAG: hypothetical protein E6G26_12805 [Actinomycetota bacterium]
MPEVAVSALAKLEAELAAALTEHHDEIVRAVARILIAMAVEEHHGRNGNVPPAGPKLCSSCGKRLAAPARSVCHSCRGRDRRLREKLRSAHEAERAAAAAGQRGPRAAELARGERAPRLGVICRVAPFARPLRRSDRRVSLAVTVDD